MVRPCTLLSLAAASVPAAALVTVVAVVAVRAARPVRRLEVTGASMLPTLVPGDRVLVVRGRRGLAVGDLAVVPDPRQPARLVVKRVVRVDGGLVTVHGDNARASTDSRDFGPVPRQTVWGRAVYRYHPPAQRGRVGRLVP